MNKPALLSLLTLCLACSSPDEPGTTPNNKPAEDQSADMPAPADMPTTPTDMPGPTDMPSDVATEPDVGADAGPVDMDAGEDTGADMAMDMAQDVPDFPDVMEALCTYPSANPMCPMGDFGPGSFITKFVIETDSEAPCCRDFSGDGVPDNFVGNQLISLAANFNANFDVNRNIQRAIDLGRLVYLFEFREWGNEEFDMFLGATMLTGTDTDMDMTDNLAGTGSFHVSGDSYNLQGLPQWEFSSAQVFNRKLTAKGGDLRIYFPGLVEAVDLWLTDVEIEANVFPGADLAAGGAVELRNGKISGALLRDRFFDSMNTVASQCACVGRSEILRKNSGRYDCVLPATVCETDPDEACQLVGDKQLCTIFGLVSRQADVDTTGDGLNDAYSFGATFEAVKTTLLKQP